VNLTDTEIRRLRVASQLLYRTGRRQSSVDIVTTLLAVQAQDIGAAPLALRARTRGLTAADVAAARDEGAIVRAWGPRGTLHLIARDDLEWLTGLLLPTSLPLVMRRLRQEGVTGDVNDLVAAVDRAMVGAGPLTKGALGERLAAQGVPASGQGIVYMAFLGAIHGRVVLGPDAGNRPTYVYTADWLGAPLGMAPDREPALAELARRYLRAHAPAAPEDLSAWSKLSLRDAREAFRLAGADGSLVEVRHRDRLLWRPRGRAPAVRQPAPLTLLPALDEYLLGWQDRDHAVPAAYARRVHPGGGMVKAVVVDDGVVVGTWRPGDLSVELFEDTGTDHAVQQELADVERFLA